MKKRLKKKVTYIVLASILGSIFMGCGSSREKLDEEAINVWLNVSSNDLTQFKEVADKWTEETGVKVNLIPESTTAADYLDTAQKPDIVWGMPATDTGRVIYADTVEEVPKDIFKDEEYISKDLIDAVSIDNIEYGVPIYQDTVVLFYNADKVGKVPDTMEELVEDAKTVGFTTEIDNKFFNYGFIAAYGGYLFKNNDGVFYDYDIGASNEGSIKGYEFLQKIVREDKLLIAGTTDIMADNNFSSGKAAYYIGKSGRVRTFTDKGINFKVSKIPTLDGNEVKPLKLVTMAVVNKNSSKKDDSWKLVKYMQDNLSEHIMKAGPKAPVLKSSLETESFKQIDYLKGLYEQSLEATLLPNIITGTAYDISIDTSISLLTLGEFTPEECGEQIKKDLEDAREFIKVE